MRFLICFLLVFATAAHAHSQAEHKLVSDDGYVWFHEDYDYRVNTVTVTNAKRDTRVANIKEVLEESASIKKLENESIKLIWGKEKLKNYLALSLNRRDISRAFDLLGGKDFFEIVFSDLYEQNLITDSLCDDCVTELDFASLSGSNLTITDLPKHYFTNDQVFLIYSSIYPRRLKIDNEFEFNTKLIFEENSEKVRSLPASLRSQPVFFESRPPKPSSGQTGGGSAELRVRKAPSHPDRQGP